MSVVSGSYLKFTSHIWVHPNCKIFGLCILNYVNCFILGKIGLIKGKKMMMQPAC